MDGSISKYEVTDRELARGRNLKIAAWASPVVLGGVPAVVFTALAFVFGTTPPAAVTLFFLAMVFSVLGLVVGLGLAGFFAYRRSNWTKEMREKIAADGIGADEIEWFRHELKPSEKRALKEITRADLLLADAYRETLASRLTATRIIKSSKKELSLVQRRRSKIRQLKTERAKEFLQQIENDAAKMNSINEEARGMLVEAETRLQMIEAAAVRGRSLADSELALKKLSSRTRDLPLALEEARRTEELVREIEAQLTEDATAPESLDSVPEASTRSGK